MHKFFPLIKTCVQSQDSIGEILKVVIQLGGDTGIKYVRYISGWTNESLARLTCVCSALPYCPLGHEAGPRLSSNGI